MNNPGLLLQAIDLHKSFGRTPALRGANLSVAEGEILALMGRSGSGKSTLLHCIAGIIPPDSGKVVLRGQRIDNASERERSILRRQQFGFVFQFGQLVPELSAVENVALPLLLDKKPRAQALQKARDWLARLELEDLEARRPGELSGGQAQRIAIARALAIQPRVIFADEPTGALDTATGDHVMQVFTQLVRDEGITVVLITHEPRVARYADRGLLVRDGLVGELPKRS